MIYSWIFLCFYFPGGFSVQSSQWAYDLAFGQGRITTGSQDLVLCVPQGRKDKMGDYLSRESRIQKQFYRKDGEKQFCDPGRPRNLEWLWTKTIWPMIVEENSVDG